MNKSILIIIAVLVLIGAVWFFKGSGMPASNGSPAAETATSSAAMPSTGSTSEAFSAYQYAANAHQIFPTLAADTKKAMGAFGYTKEDLGNNTFRITLTNSKAGFVGQSVTVTGDQSVYFIERSSGDDTDTEDSYTADDFLIAVDASGNIVK